MFKLLLLKNKLSRIAQKIVSKKKRRHDGQQTINHKSVSSTYNFRDDFFCNDA